MNNDQAEKLRQLVKNEKKCKTLFFMSGKEMVGQTVTLSNLALLLSENQRKTLIVDSGGGFFRTDTMFDISPKFGIMDVIDKQDTLESFIVPINENLEVIYMRPMFIETEASNDLRLKVKDYLKQLQEQYDFILVDLEQTNIELLKEILTLESQLLFTLNPDDTKCLKNTYKMIKKITSNTEIKKITTITNKVEEKQSSNHCYEKLKEVSNQFLGVQIDNIGYISNNAKILESLKKKTPVVILYKDSDIYSEYKEIFEQITIIK